MAQNKRRKNNEKALPQAKSEKKGSGLKMAVAVVAIAALSMGGGMVSNYVMSNPEVGITGKIEKLFTEEAVKRTVAMDTFLLNLKQVEGGERFVKIDLAVSMDSDEDEAVFNSALAKIRDTIITVLRKKTSATLTAEDGEGDLAIKHELLEAINRVSETPFVDDIFITNIVTQ